MGKNKEVKIKATKKEQNTYLHSLLNIMERKEERKIYNVSSYGKDGIVKVFELRETSKEIY